MIRTRIFLTIVFGLALVSLANPTLFDYGAAFGAGAALFYDWVWREL